VFDYLSWVVVLMFWLVGRGNGHCRFGEKKAEEMLTGRKGSIAGRRAGFSRETL
jgi:hypothetical protein